MPRLSLAWRNGRACLIYFDVVHTPRTHGSVLIPEIGKRWASEKSTVKFFDAGFDVSEEMKEDVKAFGKPGCECARQKND
jgi:hypothetical protein